MITLIYTVEPEDAVAEREWLNAMKVYPAVSVYFDWIQNKQLARVGAIVSDDAAISIKLRHPLQFQQPYKQR